MTSLIEEGLRLVLAPKPKLKEGKRVLPRVSSATGGLMPGIDPIKFSAIQDLEDLDYVERMKRLK